jgi:hypothetical protein
MSEIIKKIIRWAFSRKLRVYTCQRAITDIEMVHTKDKPFHKQHIKRKLVQELAETLLKEGAIKIESERDVEMQALIYRVRIYILNI